MTITPDEQADFNSRGKRVLIVDDNLDNAHALALLLRLMGHDARAEFSGQRALRRAAYFRPHVVFLDLSMPGMSGYEVASALRETHSDVRIIAVTALMGEEHERRCREAGFNAHFLKPIDPAILPVLLR